MNLVRLPPEKRSETAIADGRKAVAEAIRIADEHLARHEWFAGERFTFGDIVMGVFLWRYIGMGHDVSNVPHLHAWLDAVVRREAFAEHVKLPVARNLEEWTRIERELA